MKDLIDMWTSLDGRELIAAPRRANLLLTSDQDYSEVRSNAGVLKEMLEVERPYYLFHWPVRSGGLLLIVNRFGSTAMTAFWTFIASQKGNRRLRPSAHTVALAIFQAGRQEQDDAKAMEYAREKLQSDMAPVPQLLWEEMDARIAEQNIDHACLIESNTPYCPRKPLQVSFFSLAFAFRELLGLGPER